MYKLTKYYTDNCPSCKVLSPIMQQFSDRVKILEINCDDVPAAFLSKTGIHGVPTVILSYDNENTLREVARFHGPKTFKELGTWLEENIKKDETLINV